MNYLATFHTHFSAMVTCRNLTRLGLQARMAPVPRKLSSSCGTCVSYESNGPALEAMDADSDAVYSVDDGGQYVLISRNQ